MNMFKQYRKKQTSLMRPYLVGEDMDGITVSELDAKNGSPKTGDMIARNPENHSDQWLVSAKYFNENFEEVVRMVEPRTKAGSLD